MYYICKFSDSWFLYDGKKNTSRLLEKNEVDCIKNLFPAFLNDPGKVFSGMQITNVQPNKLMKLTNVESNEKSRKTAEAVQQKVP